MGFSRNSKGRNMMAFLVTCSLALVGSQLGAAQSRDEAIRGHIRALEAPAPDDISAVSGQFEQNRFSKRYLQATTREERLRALTAVKEAAKNAGGVTVDERNGTTILELRGPQTVRVELTFEARAPFRIDRLQIASTPEVPAITLTPQNLHAKFDALAKDGFSGVVYAEERLLERLVADFQQLAVADAGQLKVNIRPLLLNDLVVNALTPLAELADAELAIEMPTELMVRADEERMRQVMTNLMENAMRHQPQQLRVEVSAVQNDSAVTLYFRDNGPGIEPADRPYIFERFYRAEKSRNRASGGAGLGLTIAKGILEAMDGSIDYLEEDRPGAAFVVILPRAFASEAR